MPPIPKPSNALESLVVFRAGTEDVQYQPTGLLKSRTLKEESRRTLSGGQVSEGHIIIEVSSKFYLESANR